MPLQQFSTYDIIVDIIPGCVFLLLSYAILPTQWSSYGSGNTLLAGIILLIGGYFVGRVIHGISAYAMEPTLNIDQEILVHILKSVFVISVLPISLLTRLVFPVIHIFSREKKSEEEQTPPSFDHQIDVWFSGDQDNVPKGVDWVVINSVHIKLKNEMRNSIDENYIAQSSSLNPVAIRRYGENLLYGKETLYNKYQTLVTFFRSIMVISLIFGVLYTAVGVLSRGSPGFINSLRPGLTLPLSPILYILIGILLIITFVVATFRRRKFLTHMYRAYINDLYQMLD